MTNAVCLTNGICHLSGKPEIATSWHNICSFMLVREHKIHIFAPALSIRK